MIGAPVGMPVAGQVYGDEGPAQGEADRVPGVGVLRPAVEEDYLGTPPVGVAPHERAEAPPGLDLDGAPLHTGRAAPGEPVLLGVLTEQAELVVGGRGHAPHCNALPSRRRRPPATRGRAAVVGYCGVAPSAEPHAEQ